MKKTFTKQFEWVMGMTGSTSCFSPTRRLLLLLCLILVGVGGTKAQSDVKFNDGVRYSQWVIDSRMNDFYANTTQCGFAVYDQSGNKTADRVDGKTSLDYVVGLVAKSIIEASQYYSQFTWAQSFAKPWFLSIQNYGNKFYSGVATSGGSLDDLNAVKLFIPLRELTATNGTYPDAATYANTKTALDNAIKGLNAHNTNYRIKDENILAKTAGNDVLGGWWHKSGYQNQMWLDGAYMGPALFAELVNYSGTTKNIDSSNDWDLIVKQFTILHEMCWNETDKLPYHAFAADGGTNSTSHSDTWAGLSSTSPYVFHSASYWGRAVGWYFLALVDILEQMEKANLSSSTGYTTLKGYLAETAAGIKARQDQTTGGWYQILDENNEFSASSYNNGKSHTTTYNYIESSATALFTAAYLKAIRLGYLAENDYKTVAVNGYKCLVNNFFSVDENGKVNIFGSCRSAGLGGSGDNYKAGKEKFRDGSKPYYLLGYDVAKVEKNENKTEGKVLGAFIMAATEYERLYQSSMLLSKDLNKTYTLNSNESLSVEVLGDGTPAYQWYDANTSNPIEGATNASYTPTKSGKYYCKITVTPPSSPAAKIRAASTSGSYTITTSTANVTVESTGTETGGTGTSNDIFSLTVTYNKNYNLSSGADLNLTSDYATVTGGSALVHNGKSSAVDIIYLKNGSGNIALNGSSGTYVKLTLNTPLQEGDVIKFTSDESSIGSFYLTTTSAKDTKCSVSGGTYTVTSSDGLVNSTVLYVWSNSSGKFKSITITRTGSSITISKQPKSTDYVTGATVTPLTVVATLDGYTLSYQWYENNTNSNTGGTEISGATAESYTPTLPSTAGTTYYYCIVTATNGTETLTATSDVAAITVKDKTYTVTYNMNGHGTQIDPASDLTALPNPLPTPSAVEGYTFGGWYTDAGCTTAATPGAPISDDITLYAKWTPITDLFTLTSITSPTVSVKSKATVAVTSDNATITGGSAQLYNGHADPKDMISSNQINLNGSSSSYLKITLDNSLQVGDEIIINPATSSFILKATASTSNSNTKSFTGSYVIQQGDAVVGKNEIYLYKGSNSLIGDINITRYYPESDSRATFTYGSSQLTFTETTEGTYTTTLEIGANKRGQEISITPTAQDGATIKKDGTTVSGDITITVPSTIGQTDKYTYTVTSKDGSSTTTYIINVKVVKEKITLKYSDRNGNTEWTWNSTTTPTQPTFDQPTVKAYIQNAAGVDELLEDGSLSYTYVSDVTSVATVDASSGVITIAESGNGGAKIYATLKENENYYADPAFFNVLLEQGYSFSVDANKTAPAINTSKYITRPTAGGTEEKLVKMTFGGWKWEGYANADATTKTLGSYKVERADKATYYTDKWNDSGGKASDIASIDGHYYSWNGSNDAVDESKAASDKAIYGSIRYGWFKSPVHDSDGKTTVSYPYTLPVRGSFMTFEPTMNGTLTIYILQNGAWNTNNNGGTYVQDGDGSITYEKGDIIPGQFRPHAFQVVNQRGLTVQEFSPNYSVSTKQKVDSRYYCMLPEDEDYNKTKYNNPYNVAKWTEFADYMSTEEQKRAHDSWNSGPLGAQKIIELDNGSFLAVQKGIVKYTFHVTGNETYYFFSNFSKMGFSGANFVPDVSQPQETVSDKISTLDLSDVKAYNKITAKENGKIEGTDLKNYDYSINDKDIAPVAGVSIPQFYSITLTRTFKPNQWTTLTLPFNLTEEEVQRIFGAGTQLIQLNNATVNNGCAKLTFIYHEIQNVLPGHPYLIKPTGVEVDDNTNDATADVDKDKDGNITAFTVYSKCVNPFISQVDIDCGAYTFKGVPGYSTANVTSSTNNNWSVKFEENDIFVSDGNGKMYVSAGSSYGKGYRAWFKKKVDPASGGKINSISLEIDNPGDDDDNVVTTIDMVDVDPDVFNALGIATGVYNLNGQKVSDDMRSLPKGIYIVNGKKIVRK